MVRTHALLLAALPCAWALTAEEIAAFKVGAATCIKDAVSTGGKELCAKVAVTTSKGEHTITTNSVPSHGNHLTGHLYRDIWQGFCLEIPEQTDQTTFTVPENPVKASKPTCVPQLAGIALDGVQIWNQYAPENLVDTKLTANATDFSAGVDAGKGVFGEPMDACSGHPGPGGLAYHYHKLPAHGLDWDAICFADVKKGQPSSIVGVAVDGFPIYGPFDADGKELAPSDLDECNGHSVNGSYRYIVTSEFPYGPGCLWGDTATGTPGGQDICWFSKDWLALMKQYPAYYADCEKTPLPESTGTSGCVSYFSNPAWYQTTFGNLTDWTAKYETTCSGNNNNANNGGLAMLGWGLSGVALVLVACLGVGCYCVRSRRKLSRIIETQSLAEFRVDPTV